MHSSQRITIKEIAKQAKVSIGTVDRVLHDRGRVAEETKEKILAIAKKGNYSSNIHARNLRLNRTYDIATLFIGDNSYWEKQRTGVKRGIAEYENMGFRHRDFKLIDSNEQTRIASIESVLKDAPDGIILSPSMLITGGKAMQLLKESEVPYVFVDSFVEEASPLSFVGQEAFQSGKMAGHLLSDKHSDNSHIYIITLLKQDIINKTIKSRIQGLKSYFSDRAGVKMTHINIENDAVTFGEMRIQMLSLNKPVRIYVPNSKSYLLVDEMKDILPKMESRVLGYDLIEQNVEYLKQGYIDFIIDQQPIDQGYLSVQTLYKHLIINSEVPLKQYLPLDIITKENVMFCDY